MSTFEVAKKTIMKKNVLIILVALGLTTASAQKKGDVEFGINIGYNNSSVSDDQSNSDSGNGFNFGGSVDYYFSRAWSIKGKLIYDQKGWNNDLIYGPNGNLYRTNIDLNYLTVPIMANWHFGNNRNWYLDFGPYFGFLLNAEDSRFGTDITDSFNTNDFGLAVGIGVKIPVSKKIKIFFEFEGQGGFNDIFKENDYSAVTNSRSSLNFGMNFLMK
ncbi:PorT family protein [Flavobacterium silvisoli]|uniref:PorT family protein n=2 Tax=Flavobacterium silvisoli TaxID=2529433 RepID=A0A4Q9Z163_9FLAO|nr:PorT family protein [Flavobacterium silvisoli]